MVSEETKRRMSAACQAACEACDGLWVVDACVGDDETVVELTLRDEYHTRAETNYYFYVPREASLAEIAESFASAANNIELEYTDTRYIDAFDEGRDEDEQRLSEDDFETFRYMFQDQLGRFASALAAHALDGADGGYLIVAGGVRWDGASGYKLADSASAALDRDYEATFRFKDVDAQAGVARMVESSHDAPTGASVTVIALTEDERDKIENEMGFDEVMAFARERAGA